MENVVVVVVVVGLMAECWKTRERKLLLLAVVEGDGWMDRSILDDERISKQMRNLQSDAERKERENRPSVRLLLLMLMFIVVERNRRMRRIQRVAAVFIAL
jgi:hypothetical protein